MPQVLVWDAHDIKKRARITDFAARESYDEDGVGESGKQIRGGRISRTGLAHRQRHPVIAHERAPIQHRWPGEDEERREERGRREGEK
jgi:hypothetical protein